jgi:hypothetical protein
LPEPITLLNSKIIVFFCFIPIFGYAQRSKIDSVLFKPRLNFKSPVDTTKKNVKDNLPFYNVIKNKKPGKPDINNQANNYLKPLNVKTLIKTISFHASGFVEGRYSDWKDTLSNMPPSYLRVMVNPTVKIAGIPLVGNVFYSTEEGPIKDNLKNISLRFDYQQYYNGVYQRIYGQKRDLLQNINRDQYKNPNLDLDFNQQMEGYENQLKKSGTPDISHFQSQLKAGEGNTKVDLLCNLDKLEKMGNNKLDRMYDSINRLNPNKASQLKQMIHLDSVINLKDKDFNKLTDSIRIHDTSQFKFLKDLRQTQQIKKFSGDNLQNNLPDLQKSGLISKEEKILLNFKKFGVGDNYPVYTPFSLMGMKIRGIDVQYCPEHLIFSFSAGISPQVRAINRFTINQDNKNVLAGSIGFGKLTTDYIRLSYVEARSHSGINYDSILYPPAQKFSRVLTTDFSYALGKKLIFKGEIANSNLSDQPQLEYYPEEPVKPSSKFLTRDMNWAGDISLKYTEEKLKAAIIGEIKEIQPNFISYAMPFLRTDYMQYQVKLQKQLFHKQVIMETYWIKEVDNLSGRYPNSSIINSFGGSLGLYFINLPYLLLSYNPTSMSTQSLLDTFHYQSSFKTYTAQAGYQFYVSSATFLSTVNAFMQEENFTNSSQSSHHKMLWINQTVKLKIPLTFSLSAGYLNINYNNEEINSNDYEGTISYSLSKKLNLGLCYVYNIYRYNGDKQAFLVKANWLINNNQQIMLMISRIESSSYKDFQHTNFYDLSVKYAFKW